MTATNTTTTALLWEESDALGLGLRARLRRDGDELVGTVTLPGGTEVFSGRRPRAGGEKAARQALRTVLTHAARDGLRRSAPCPQCGAASWSRCRPAAGENPAGGSGWTHPERHAAVRAALASSAALRAAGLSG